MATADERVERWLKWLGVACVLAYLVTLPLPRVDNHIIGSDGLSLYAYLPSVLLDGDLDLGNQYQRYVDAGIRTALPDPIPATGLYPNVFPIGPAILWAPFFLVAHAVASLWGRAGDLLGYGYLYEGVTCLGTVLYGLSGLAATWRWMRGRYDLPAALPALLGLWWSTNLIYYLLLEPSMGHALSFACVAWLLAVRGSQESPRTPVRWAALGALLGLAALVRTQNVVWALLLVADLIAQVKHGKGLRCLIWGGLAGVVALAVFMPQMVTWRIMYGQWITIPQGESFMRWGSPMVLQTLFSSRSGLFTWHPIYLLGAIGLIWRHVRRPHDRLETTVFLAIIVLQVYINASALDWWAGDAFGGRRFLCIAPILGLGVAELVSRWRMTKRGMALPWAILTVLTVWNMAFIVQYRLGFIPRDQALTWQQFVTDKYLLPGRLLRLALGMVR